MSDQTKSTKKFTEEEVTKMTSEEIKGLSKEDQRAVYLIKKGIAAKNWAEHQKDFALIRELCEKPGNEKYLEALKKARPTLFSEKAKRVPGAPVISLAAKFVQLVTERKTITEGEVFKLMKLGRKDCAMFIRSELKKAEPANRVWINFDLDNQNGIYVYLGKGEIAPAKYTGPKPPVAVVDVNKAHTDVNKAHTDVNKA